MGLLHRDERHPGWLISIHPSRVGWDSETSGAHSQPGHFNPPIPCGMGLRAPNRKLRPLYFNPPIPCGMGLWTATDQWLTYYISIHPSRVGWDSTERHDARYQRHFNPPIPCGMGQGSGSAALRIPHFNPPIPCGMGLVELSPKYCLTKFQSTHPVWDGTIRRGFRRAVRAFQSTHPVWDGTCPRCGAKMDRGISIHPSRVGWDGDRGCRQ